MFKPTLLIVLLTSAILLLGAPAISQGLVGAPVDSIPGRSGEEIDLRQEIFKLEAESIWLSMLSAFGNQSIKAEYGSVQYELAAEYDFFNEWDKALQCYRRIFSLKVSLDIILNTFFKRKNYPQDFIDMHTKGENEILVGYHNLLKTIEYAKTHHGKAPPPPTFDEMLDKDNLINNPVDVFHTPQSHGVQNTTSKSKQNKLPAH